MLHRAVNTQSFENGKFLASLKSQATHPMTNTLVINFQNDSRFEDL